MEGSSDEPEDQVLYSSESPPPDFRRVQEQRIAARRILSKIPDRVMENHFNTKT